MSSFEALSMVTFCLSVCGILLLLAGASLMEGRRKAFTVYEDLGPPGPLSSVRELPVLPPFPNSAAILQEASHRNKDDRALLQSLPLVMEEILMAVEAGHDVLSALRVILSAAALLEEEYDLPSKGKFDTKDKEKNLALTKLLLVYRMTEAGRAFQDAAEEVAFSTNSVAFRHALLHLAVCYRDGGELLMPLRELSDACQLSYQEDVEEYIAKLPVRATPALVCSFAGLMLCAMSIPMSKLLDSTTSIIEMHEVTEKNQGERL